jgi:hypothetical protein
VSAADRFVTPAQLPSEHERELLTILLEECAEVQQRVTKVLRFGLLEVQPGQELDNRERLSLEVGDLMEMLARAENAGLLVGRCVADGRATKARKLAKYMQTERAP